MHTHFTAAAIAQILRASPVVASAPTTAAAKAATVNQRTALRGIFMVKDAPLCRGKAPADSGCRQWADHPQAKATKPGVFGAF
jgi:hypothetical protein